jgi:hypothetical protein
MKLRHYYKKALMKMVISLIYNNKRDQKFMRRVFNVKLYGEIQRMA